MFVDEDNFCFFLFVTNTESVDLWKIRLIWYGLIFILNECSATGYLPCLVWSGVQATTSELKPWNCLQKCFACLVVDFCDLCSIILGVARTVKPHPDNWTHATVSKQKCYVYVSWPLHFPAWFKFYLSSIKTGTCKFIQNHASYCSLLFVYFFSSFPRRFDPVWAFVWRWHLLAQRGSGKAVCE